MLAVGNLPKVSYALIFAKQCDIELSFDGGCAFDTVCAMDLAGRDVLAIVNEAVNPTTVPVPFIGSNEPAAFIESNTTDGQPVMLRAEATCYLVPIRVIGGAGTETVAERIQEAIGNRIGSESDLQSVIANQKQIVEDVLAMDLGQGTVYDIIDLKLMDIRSG